MSVYSIAQITLLGMAKPFEKLWIICVLHFVPGIWIVATATNYQPILHALGSTAKE